MTKIDTTRSALPKIAKGTAEKKSSARFHMAISAMQAHAPEIISSAISERMPLQPLAISSGSHAPSADEIMFPCTNVSTPNRDAP